VDEEERRLDPIGQNAGLTSNRGKLAAIGTPTNATGRVRLRLF
jgi:hypothetical protein